MNLQETLPIPVSAIIVAGGNGVRMGASVRKQFLSLGDRPVICHTLNAFDQCSDIDAIYLVVPPDDIENCLEKWCSSITFHKKIQVVPGGRERQDSVYQGILAVSDQRSGIVVIHDGVRPFITPQLISACAQEARRSGACIAGIPVQDTVKQVRSHTIQKTLDRNVLWTAQTPQAFEITRIRTAHENARKDGVVGTDDAMLIERMGWPVRIIEGSRLNIKITTPEDLALAEAIWQWIPPAVSTG